MNFINGLLIYETVENIVDDIKAELDSNNINLLHDIKPTSNNVMVTCPVHKEGQESKPSCGISTIEQRQGDNTIEVGTVHCFTCGYTTDLAGFISYVCGYNDAGKFGFKWLGRRYVNIEVDERKPIHFNFNPQEEVETYVQEQELAKYRFTHPYMYGRGLTDQMIEFFDIGYDSERDMITFPVKNKYGKCLFVQKRSVIGKQFHNDTDASKKTMYGLDKVWEHLDWVKQHGCVYVVESPIDVATAWKWGYPTVGTMQAIPTKFQLELLDELPVRRLISAQDNDEGGQIGAERLRKGTSKLVERLIFPQGKKDINEMTQEQFRSCNTTLIY